MHGFTNPQMQFPECTQQHSQYGCVKLIWFLGCPSESFGPVHIQSQMHFNLQLSPHGHPMSIQNNSQIPSHATLKQKYEHVRCVTFIIFSIVSNSWTSKKMVQTLLKPISFQFHLIAKSKAAFGPRVRGMSGERMDTQKYFHHQAGVWSIHLSRSSGSVLWFLLLGNCFLCLLCSEQLLYLYLV